MRLVIPMKMGKWNIKILHKFKFIKSFIGNLSLNYEENAKLMDPLLSIVYSELRTDLKTL